MQIIVRYNPHANHMKPYHAVIQHRWNESLACTLPQRDASEALDKGVNLREVLLYENAS